MSVILRAEFAEICKTTPAVVNTNVSRGKIITCGAKDKYVDTENWTNMLFKKKYLELAKKAKPTRKKKEMLPTKESIEKDIEDSYKKVVERIEPKKYKGTKEETEEEKQSREKANEDAEAIGDWDLRKKKADALRAEELARKEKLNVEKLMGQLIPFDLMKLIIKVNVQDILKSFVSESTNLSSIYCDILADGDREKLAELTNKLQYAIQDIVKRVENTTAKEIENVIEEFSESRLRGEKK